RVPPWTPQEEQELRELYWKYKEVEGTGGLWGLSGTPGGVAGALSLHPCCPTGGDIIAAILAHLPTPGRTRRQVVKQLVRM
ncbi:TIM protein, partial [Molothrus ater]|nr:TIM protein [Molothrus ater]